MVVAPPHRTFGQVLLRPVYTGMFVGAGSLIKGGLLGMYTRGADFGTYAQYLGTGMLTGLGVVLSVRELERAGETIANSTSGLGTPYQRFVRTTFDLTRPAATVGGTLGSITHYFDPTVGQGGEPTADFVVRSLVGAGIGLAVNYTPLMVSEIHRHMPWQAVGNGVRASSRAVVTGGFNGLQRLARNGWDGLETVAGGVLGGTGRALQTSASTGWNGGRVVAGDLLNGIGRVAGSSGRALQTSVGAMYNGGLRVATDIRDGYFDTVGRAYTGTYSTLAPTIGHRPAVIAGLGSAGLTSAGLLAGGAAAGVGTVFIGGRLAGVW